MKLVWLLIVCDLVIFTMIGHARKVDKKKAKPGKKKIWQFYEFANQFKELYLF